MQFCRSQLFLIAALLCPSPARPQEATSGVTIPVSISGDSRLTQNSEDGEQNKAGFRALISPSVRLGSHWFAYSVLDVESSSYLDYSPSEKTVSFTVMQAYLGYKVDRGSASFLFKAGRLASAFGHYPLEYDDAKSPFIQTPSTYTATLPLRPDQLPCKVPDIIWQEYGEEISFHCGGSTNDRYGLTPVTLYGIPGIETQVSWNRLDGRLQLTNSSPANPLSLLAQSQSIQWTAGGGYSFRGGVHVGASGFRGRYLDRIVAPLLPAGKRAGDFPASGLGVDLQWSRGPWSLEGEWQRFQFVLPGFPRAPSEQSGYAQLKRIISPRLFVALRSGFLRPGGTTDAAGNATSQIDSNQETQELVFGYRLNRMQILKVGFVKADRNAWSLNGGYWPAERSLAVQIQLVTSVNAFSKGF